MSGSGNWALGAGQNVKSPVDPRLTTPGFQSYLTKHNLQNPFDINSQNPAEQMQAIDWANARLKESVDSGGMPERPDFNSLIDKNTGLLNGNLKMNPHNISTTGVGGLGITSALGDIQNRFNGVNLDKTGLNELQKEGMRNGPSDWANLMKKNLSDQEVAQLDKVGAQANGANAAASNSLAMRGGLGSGAATSLAKDMQRGINAGSQGVRRDISNQGLGVDIQDEVNRQSILSQLPGMQLAALQPEMQKATSLNQAQMDEQARKLAADQYNSDTNLKVNQYAADQANNADKYNIQNSLNETLQQRGYDVNSYNEMMKAWGANKTADAEANASGGKK